MKIVVQCPWSKKKLTYDSDGHNVKIGDVVELITPDFRRVMGEDDTYLAKVVSLNSDYDGSLMPIVDVVRSTKNSVKSATRVQNFIKSHYGQLLLNHYVLSDKGIWKITFAKGIHDYKIVSGVLEDVIEFAVKHEDFMSGAFFGEVAPYEIFNVSDSKRKNKIVELQAKKAKIEAELKELGA